MEVVTKVTFIKILARLVMMSPVGNPSIWQVNAKIAGKGKGMKEACRVYGEDFVATGK